MARKKRVRLTSPAGVARYPWLVTPDTRFDEVGKYSVGLVLDPEEHAEFLARLDELADEAYENAVKELKEKKRHQQAKQVQRQDPYTAEYDEEGNETGKVIVKFSSKAKITTKDGRVIDLAPKLFDAKGQPVQREGLTIYGGSILRVNFTPNPYYVAATKLAGVSLQLNAVQILELVSGEADASFFGFEVEEDGYEFEGNDAVDTDEDTDEGTDDDADETDDFDASEEDF